MEHAGVRPGQRAPGQWVRDDRVLPLTRHVAFHVTHVLLMAFLVLFVFPGQTDRLFAWTVRPEMTPMLMGAGYFGGAFYFFNVYRARSWHTVSAGFLGVTVFATLMLVATVLHWDRFNHGHPIFWAWIVIYVVTPILVPYVWWRNRALDPGRRPGDLMLPLPIRWAFGVLGFAELIGVLVVFAVPTFLIDVWPWTLTPLTARVVAGWFSLTGAFAIVIALDGRWSAVRMTFRAALVGISMILVSCLRAWGDFDPTSPWRYGFVGFLVFLLVGFAALLAIMQRAERSRASA